MTKTCSHCGKKFGKTDKFCDECGIELPKNRKEELKTRKERLKEEREEAKKIKKQKEANKHLIKRVSIIMLVLLTVAGIVFLPTKTQAYTIQVPYTDQEPYQTQEAYTIQVPYQTQEAYTGYESVTKSKTVKENDCDYSNSCTCTQTSWFGLGSTCVECSCTYQESVPTTKYQTVTKYKDETRYRTVTKYRDVTKFRDETRYRKVNWIFGECFYNC